MQQSVGAQLRRAREARGMTVEGVGAAIKLAARQVEAIEADAYAELMNPTYARGFIRNYAALIGLDPQALLAQLDQQQVRATPQLVEQADVGVAMPVQSPRRKWLLPLFALSVPVVVAIALYMWSEFWTAPPGEQVQVEQEAVMPPPDAVAEPETEPATPSADAQAADAVATEATLAAALPEASPPPAESASASPVTGQRQLAFTFAADSWVEIRDAEDRIILSELNRAGSSRTVGAVFPVSLVIGNAKSVRLSIDGTPHDLAPATKVDVARLRLE
ncbi:RodZ domain-containing protein [Methyloversatilis sp. NSM2]|uniref:RodZ domain-containing protein n=1 Tax=Methyloversatilis sp. NSM2 TaxID=3134135 RepID=UPI0031124200